MNASSNNSPLDACITRADAAQDQLDMCSFQLKTLNDLSKELFESVDVDTILKNFLFNTTGNFGVIKGFVFVMGPSPSMDEHFAAIGFDVADQGLLRSSSKQRIMTGKDQHSVVSLKNKEPNLKGSFGLEQIFPFAVTDKYQGFLGLGPKLMNPPFTAAEKEMLETMLNNLVVAIKNAWSFKKVMRLNQRLRNQNVELAETLQTLKATIKKVELLTNIKENLSKFVPMTVTSLIEASPEGVLPESREQDLSVLFLDIEGYTKLCEKFDSTKVNQIVEKHFSVFMDAIHANHGDVNETAGDGLMVLFLNENKRHNALDAVRTALSIQKDTRRIGRETNSLYRPLDIHMGIHSGKALVGATKFSSLTGSRWTYTARGRIVNVAARIGSLSTGNSILISSVTASRVRHYNSVKSMGTFKLKNVSEEVEVFKLLPTLRA